MFLVFARSDQIMAFCMLHAKITQYFGRQMPFGPKLTKRASRARFQKTFHGLNLPQINIYSHRGRSKSIFAENSKIPNSTKKISKNIQNFLTANNITKSN